MKSLKENWALYLIILILAILYFTKEDGSIKVEQKNYDKKLDSLTTLIESREVGESKTINNVTNNIIKGESEKIWYSQSDSLRLRFIDSVLGR